MARTVGWARIWPAAKRVGEVTLRQGAWYPVLSSGDTRLVLDVSGRQLAVRQEALEVRARRPDRFTVVYRSREDHNPARGTAADVGRVYAVCPICATRVPLAHRPQLGTSGAWAAGPNQAARCDKCGHKGIVAWWETG
jgi:hypothetical protein